MTLSRLRFAVNSTVLTNSCTSIRSAVTCFHRASFRSSLGANDLVDGRFAVSEYMTDLDRQVCFADYVTELQAVQDEKMRRIREAQRRAEKSQRDAYRDILAGLARQGILGITTRWASVEEQLSKDPTYGPVASQDRDAPREILEDFVEDMRDVYRRDKPILLELIEAGNIEVSEQTTFEEFRDALVNSSGPEHGMECKRLLNREPVSSAVLMFHELVLSSKNAIAAVSKRQSSAADESEDEGEIIEDA